MASVHSSTAICTERRREGTHASVELLTAERAGRGEDVAVQSTNFPSSDDASFLGTCVSELSGTALVRWPLSQRSEWVVSVASLIGG